MSLAESILRFLIYEVIAGLAIVVAILGGLMLRRRLRDVRSVRALIAGVKKEEDTRVRALQAFLVDRGMAEEEADEMAQRLIEEEKVFYQHLVEVYLKRDPGLTSKLPEHVRALAGAYRELAGVQGEGSVAAGDTGETAAEVAELRQEINERQREAAALAGDNQALQGRLQVLDARNQQLSDNLRTALNTLKGMLDEYTRLYGGGADSAIAREVGEMVQHLEASVEEVPDPAPATGHPPEPADLAEWEDELPREAKMEALEAPEHPERAEEAAEPERGGQLDQVSMDWLEEVHEEGAEEPPPAETRTEEPEAKDGDPEAIIRARLEEAERQLKEKA
jgi:hypothetical protein